MKSRNNILIFIGVILFGLIIWTTIVNKRNATSRNEISYSTFLKKVDAHEIKDVIIIGTSIIGSDTKGNKFKVNYPQNDIFVIDTLKKNNVDITVRKVDSNNENTSMSMFSWLFIIFIIGLIWYFFTRKKSSQGGGMPPGNNSPFNFGKSKARMITPKDGRVTFDDVAGVEEAKEELTEVVDFLKSPEKFKKLGAKIPKGCLLIGSPGTGKTLLARAVAGEAKVPFFVISGSDFVEMFVGVGASRVRNLFEQAKKHAPCIVFIDEIDAVGRQRGAGLGGGNDEREQTLNQLLVEMDGFSINSGIIVIAATNRPDVLDPALLRPGRFDRQITVPYPDIIGREQILSVHSKKIPLDSDVNINIVAKGTTGFSGADLANLVNEAALFAAKNERSLVSMSDFEQARDKIIMGSERKSMKLTSEERELTAYHEAGHTVIALNVKNYFPLHKVSIVPRGRALGITAVLPEKDQFNYNEKQLLDQITMLFGGRVTEEIIYGKDSITTGASNDIQVASNLARRMVTEWGYSDSLGRIRYESNESEVFLGHSVTQKKNVSEITAQKIDKEIKDIIDKCEDRAKKIIKENLEDLNLITQALLKYETLSAAEINELLKIRDIDMFKSNSNTENDINVFHKMDPVKKQTSLPILDDN